MKRVGPELKMPEVKVPQGVNDFYQDLRDRRLLPVIALVVVAIVAVPFLLGNSKKAEVPPSTSEALAKASGSSVDRKSELVVVRSTPGLRSYKKRLKQRSKSDPFKQRFTGPVTTNAQLGEGGGEETSTVTTAPEPEGESVTVTSSEPEPSPPVSTPTHIENPKSQPGLTLYAWEINVKITKQSGGAGSSSVDEQSGGAGSSASQSDPSVRKGVRSQTPLPSPKAPVVTYIGPSKKDLKKAVLLVSNKVTAVFGESKCANSEDQCQLVEVEPGFPVTLVYGPNEVHYVVNVLKQELVAIHHHHS
jgi:hypothetical protein